MGVLHRCKGGSHWLISTVRRRFPLYCDVEKGLFRNKWATSWQNKQTKWYVRPAKTQISLGIRPVWSKSSLSAWKKLGSLATHWAHSEDSDQTGRTCHFVGFVTKWLKWCSWASKQFYIIKHFISLRWICSVYTLKPKQTLNRSQHLETKVDLENFLSRCERMVHIWAVSTAK